MMADCVCLLLAEVDTAPPAHMFRTSTKVTAAVPLGSELVPYNSSSEFLKK